jgi:hypothetical protein
MSTVNESERMEEATRGLRVIIIDVLFPTRWRVVHPSPRRPIAMPGCPVVAAGVKGKERAVGRRLQDPHASVVSHAGTSSRIRQSQRNADVSLRHDCFLGAGCVVLNAFVRAGRGPVGLWRCFVWSVIGDCLCGDDSL